MTVMQRGTVPKKGCACSSVWLTDLLAHTVSSWLLKLWYRFSGLLRYQMHGVAEARHSIDMTSNS